MKAGRDIGGRTVLAAVEPWIGCDRFAKCLGEDETVLGVLGGAGDIRSRTTGVCFDNEGRSRALIVEACNVGSIAKSSKQEPQGDQSSWGSLYQSTPALTGFLSASLRI
jgi:hypothetical protein